MKDLHEPMAGCWLTSPPSIALGLAFESREFKMFLRFRLGLPIRADPERPTTCLLCGEMEDPFGDHRLCCQRASHTPKHNKVADALGRCIASAGVPVEREVPVGGGGIRPADLLAHWGPASDAIDFTIRHNFATFDSPGAPDRVTGAATSKHAAYDGVCRLANMSFSVFGLSTLGGTGAEVMRVIGTLRDRLKERFGKREGLFLTQQAMERITVATQRGVAALLLSGPDGCCSLPADSVDPRTDGGVEDKNHKAWQLWARAHGFEPAPSSGIDGSAGIRILVSTPAPPAWASSDPMQVVGSADDPAADASGRSAPGAELPPPAAGQTLYWEDREMGWRVWARS